MSSSPSFRNQLEGWLSSRGEPELHNRVHVWVGGSMLPMTSPNDPVFFLHHCNIDRIWAQWQAQHPGAPYLPTSGGPIGHNLNDPMLPWGGSTTVASVLDHRSLGYCYDTEPGCTGKVKESLKPEKIEIKETIKREKLEKREFKELKREKIEKRELKETIKREKPEKREIEKGVRKEIEKIRPDKDFKERKPEIEKGIQREKDFVEKDFGEKGPREKLLEGGIDPRLGAPAGEPVDQRIERLEGMVEELVHFIGGELRPDLGEGALGQEPDAAALSDQLAKDASDAKQAKDSKDVEKPSEF